MWKVASQFPILRTNVRNALSIYIDVVKESCLLTLVTKVLDCFFSKVILVDKEAHIKKENRPVRLTMLVLQFSYCSWIKQGFKLMHTAVIVSHKIDSNSSVTRKLHWSFWYYLKPQLSKSVIYGRNFFSIPQRGAVTLILCPSWALR